MAVAYLHFTKIKIIHVRAPFDTSKQLTGRIDRFLIKTPQCVSLLENLTKIPWLERSVTSTLHLHHHLALRKSLLQVQVLSIHIWYGPDIIHAVRYICNKLSCKRVENAHVLLFRTHRLCLHTAKDWHQAYIFSRVKMNLIKLFFISVGATLQPLVFSVIVGLSTLCNS